MKRLSSNAPIDTLEKYEALRNIPKTMFLQFVGINPRDYVIDKYVHAGQMCENEYLTLDHYNVVSYNAIEVMQLKKAKILSCLAHRKGQEGATMLILKLK